VEGTKSENYFGNATAVAVTLLTAQHVAAASHSLEALAGLVTAIEATIHSVDDAFLSSPTPC